MKAVGQTLLPIVQEVCDHPPMFQVLSHYVTEECRQASRLNIRSIERNVAPDARGMAMSH